MQPKQYNGDDTANRRKSGRISRATQPASNIQHHVENHTTNRFGALATARGKILDNWRALTQFYTTTKNNAQRQPQLKNIYKQIDGCDQDMERVLQLMTGHERSRQHRER